MYDISSATRAGANAIEHLRNFPGEHRVAVGLSGGVDSSLSAALLVEAGWKVEGLTLWLMSGKGSCCSDGLVDAAGICDELNIPHHIVDSRSKFQKEIVEHLVNGYQNGITPLPCSKCNRSVKFSEMISWAKRERNLHRIATGHYARVRHAQNQNPSSSKSTNSKDRHQLLRGMDNQKDQSYFLYDLSQDLLGSIVFPLGELTKLETRKEAEKYGLRTAKKAESQDLCLAEHHGSMKAFIDNYIPSRNGDIVLQDGTIIGTHNGIQHFTIGQRKGLQVSWEEPLHVIKIEAATNRVFVAPRTEAGRPSCIVGSVNWVSIPPPSEIINVEVQIRYRGVPVNAQLIPMKCTEEDKLESRPYRCELLFKEKQFSIAPGQAAVFYDKEILLGGGIIKE